MSTRSTITTGEWYHCYNRGVDQRTVFETPEEFERFMVHMYLSNRVKNIRASDLPDTRLSSVLGAPSLQNFEPLVDVGAYALMPNHVHFVLRQKTDGGIANFMHKLFTGYTKYFNSKHSRTGSLFAGTFKSKHIPDDLYFKKVVSYVLLNPAELFEPAWKMGSVEPESIEKELSRYPYSSLPEFFGIERPQGVLVQNSFDEYYDRVPLLSEMLHEAREYYREHAPQG